MFHPPTDWRRYFTLETFNKDNNKKAFPFERILREFAEVESFLCGCVAFKTLTTKFVFFENGIVENDCNYLYTYDILIEQIEWLTVVDYYMWQLNVHFN